MFDTDAQTLRLTSAPTFTIGDTPETVLHLLRGAVFLGDEAVIANAGFDEIMFVDASGRVTRREGREGSGPGEYRYITGVFVDADGIVVWDSGNQRMTRLDRRGSFVEFKTLRVPGFRTLEVIGVADGRALVEYREPGFPGREATDNIRQRQEVGYALVDLATGDVIHRTVRPGLDRLVRREGGQGPQGGIGVIFGRDATGAMTPFGAVLGDTESLELTYLLASGDTAHDNLPSANIPADAAWVQQVRDSLGANALTMPARLGPESGFVRQMQQFRLSLLEELPSESTLPAYSRLLGTTDGLLWIRAYPPPAADSVQWVGVDAALHPVRQFVCPIGVRVLDVTDEAVLLAEMQPSGEYIVRRYDFVAVDH